METASLQSSEITTDVLPQDVSALNEDQIQDLIAEASEQNDVIEREIQMFEKFLTRVDLRSVGVLPPTAPSKEDGATAGVASGAAPSGATLAAGGAAAAGSTLSASPETSAAASQRGRSKSKSSTVGPGPERVLLRLAMDQKCEIAARECDELRAEILRNRETAEKIQDGHRATVEEAEMHLDETKKARYEFERDIAKGAVNKRTGQVVAERMLRYIEDKVRAKDTLVGKLRLKNSTLRVMKKKLEMQIKQKEEMGEVLHEVDFNQLKIENQQYLEKIDEKNQELLRLKLMAGNTLQVLNQYKKRLQTLTQESDRLSSEFKSRNDLSEKIEAELIGVDADRIKAEETNQSIRKEIADFRVPDVLDYVKETASLQEMSKIVSSWERKVEIAEMALHTHRKAWHQLKMAHAVASGGNWMLDAMV